MLRMWRARLARFVLPVVSTAALLAGACAAPQAPSTPTPAPAKPAAAPTPAPAKPAERPVEQPAATARPAAPPAVPEAKPGVAASPAVKPATQPAASPAAQPAPVASPAAAGANLSGTVKIVSSLPRTGPSKGQTDSMVNAIKLALEEVNYRVGDATIVYEDMDDATAARGAWDASKEAENATRAVNDPDVMAYIGTFNSGAAKVAIPILCPANLVMISPANTYPGLTKNIEAIEQGEPEAYYPNCTRNYTRVVPTDEIQGTNAAQWAQDLGATRAYILDDTDLYGAGIATFFHVTARKIGLQTVGGPEGIDPKVTDYRALAQKIRQAGADMVYFGGITQSNAGKLWQDLRATLGEGAILMGPDGIYEEAFIDSAGRAAEGTYLTFGGVPPNKLTGKGAAWYAAYKQKYGAEPEAYAAYAYEATKVVLDAIQRAGRKDRAAIRDALFNTRNYNGVLGTWSFTATGDTTLETMSGIQVKNGAFEFVKLLQTSQ